MLIVAVGLFINEVVIRVVEGEGGEEWLIILGL